MAEKPLEELQQNRPFKKNGRIFFGRLGFLGGFWTFSLFIVGFGVNRF